MNRINIVSGVVIKQGMVLLVRKKNRDFWTLPGGKKAGGESREETLVREFSEELPRLRIEKNVFLDSFIGTAPHGKYPLVAYVYLVKTHNFNIKIGREIAEARWVSDIKRYKTNNATFKIAKLLHKQGLLTKA